MEIVIHADQENDSCYIGLGASGLEAGAVRRSVRVTEDITLDFDGDDRLLGLDVMSASRNLPDGAKSLAGADDVIGVKEAAEMAGVQRSNFVRDFANRADFPQPVAELATGRVWLRSRVAAYLASRTPNRQKAPMPGRRTA